MKANEFKFLDDNGKQTERPKPRAKVVINSRSERKKKFDRMCRRRGHNPDTIRKRVSKYKMTLREALRVPQAGTPAHKHWMKGRAND